MQEINLNGAMELFQSGGATLFGATNANNQPIDNSFDTQLNEKIASYQDKSAKPTDKQDNTKPAEKTVDGNGAEQKVTHTEQKKDKSQDTGDATKGEVVRVSDLIEKLHLNEDQVAELAYQLGVTVGELQGMTIKINSDALINTPLTLKGKNQFNPQFQDKLGNSSVIKGILQDGTEINIASMLNLDKEGEKANLDSLVNKIATALGLDGKQVKTMTKELGIEKIAIKTKAPEKSDTNVVKGLISQKGIPTEADKSATNQQGSPDAQTDGQKHDSPFLEKKAGSSEVQKATLNKAMDIEGSPDGDNSAVKGTSEFKQVQTSDKVVTQIVTQKVDGKEVQVRQVTEVRHTGNETSSKIMSQIVEKAQVLSLPNRTEARITLTPAQLGSIDIKIMVQDAQVRGHIVVDNQSVKQIVEQNINQLKDAIANQGINLGGITVDINENKAQFEGQNNNGNDGFNGTARAFSADDALAKDAQKQAFIAKEQFRRRVNNSVVYMTA